MDKKTELMVWVLEHRVTQVVCKQMSTGVDTDRTEVVFIDDWSGESYTVEDWHEVEGIRRSEYDTGMGLEFSPRYAGMIRCRDSRAQEIVKNREEKSELLEERDELQARLDALNAQLGGA